MKYLFPQIAMIILIIVFMSSCSKKKGLINKDQIMGDWKTITGENEYVRFEKVDSDYVYSAYTYDRLAASGTWELKDDNITINFDNGTSTSLAVKFRDDTMEFNNGEEKYVRMVLSADAKTPVTDISDTEILEQIIKNFDVVFSEAEPFSEDWVAQNVKWQKIRAEMTLKKDDLTELNELSHKFSEFLEDRGFSVDSTRISEKVATYTKGKLCVMLRLNSSENPSIGETVSIDVISGLEGK